MYKVVLSHIIIPGKYDDLAEWCREADKKRKQENPAYVPPSRFINQYGDSFKVQIEFEFSEMPSEPMNYGKSNQPEFFEFIVPGTTRMEVYKSID
jgi:hypothetical protein